MEIRNSIQPAATSADLIMRYSSTWEANHALCIVFQPALHTQLPVVSI